MDVRAIDLRILTSYVIHVATSRHIAHQARANA